MEKSMPISFPSAACSILQYRNKRPAAWIKSSVFQSLLKSDGEAFAWFLGMQRVISVFCWGSLSPTRQLREGPRLGQTGPRGGSALKLLCSNYCINCSLTCSSFSFWQGGRPWILEWHAVYTPIAVWGRIYIAQQDRGIQVANSSLPCAGSVVLGRTFGRVQGCFMSSRL